MPKTEEKQTKIPFLPVKSETYFSTLILVLCSITRTFIVSNCKGVQSLQSFCQYPAAAPPSPLAPLYAALSSALRSCVIPPSQLVAILDETEKALQEVYTTITESQRQELEMQLLAAGEIPPILVPVIKKILSGPVEQARQRAGDSETELAFKDWSSVSLGKDWPLKKIRRKDVLFDSIKKTEVKKTKTTRVRVCLRCTGHMEDSLLSGRNSRGWMVNQGRSCYCGGHWILEPPQAQTTQ